MSPKVLRIPWEERADQANSKKIIKELDQKIKELDELVLNEKIHLSGTMFTHYFLKWRREVEYIIAHSFGENSRQFTNFKQTTEMPRSIKGKPEQLREYRQKKILAARAEVEAVISEIEKFGLPEVQEASTSLPRIFIAHGGKTMALDKLCDFIKALNLDPLIAEETPSEGRSVNEQVEWCLNNSDCAIILGTADDKDLKDGKLYPRRNVHIEIGRVQERFPNRVIYLLEEGASFPSNISEKVYERFTQKNMEKAFIKIAKELTKFGIIMTGSTKESNV